MRPEAGSYFIRPIDAPENNFLSVGPVPKIFPPPDQPVKVLNIHDPWVLKDSDDNTFNVYAGKVSPGSYKWILNGNVLFNSAKTREPGNFRFESAGNDLLTIGVPNEDRLLTYISDATFPQLVFLPADGSRSQRFQVLPIHKD